MAVALTTVDNPYDPLDDFEHWFHYDISHGNNTCGYLDRIAHTSDMMTQEEYSAELERAIDDIIRLDFMHVYKKVKHD